MFATVRQVVCDHHGRKHVIAETVPLSLDGHDYELDLCSECREELDEVLAPFLAKARRKRKPRSTATDTKSTRRKTGSRHGASPAEIRQWARDHGHRVSDHGRISQEIQKAFKEDARGRRAA